MGHLGRGRKKQFKPAHLQWLSRFMKRMNERRKLGLSIRRRKPNTTRRYENTIHH